MNTVKPLFFVVFCSLILFSCEKKIDLDLKESDQMFVVEAIVHDNLGDNYVLLSKTRPYANNSASEKISNASVLIKDNTGGVHSLHETTPGYYTDPTLLGVAGRTYDLEIIIGGEVITASSFMNVRTVIDSISYEELDEPDGEDEYEIYCHFKDSLNYENFYRIRSFKEDEQEDGYVSFLDDLIDGKSTFYQLSDMTFFEGDEVRVELLSIDEANYRYFTAVSSSQGGDVPGNPISNLKGDKVVGYFGAYAKSEVIVTIGE